jgi:hypothetical protein
VLKEKRRLSPTENVEKKNDSDDSRSIIRRKATEKCRLLPVYQNPRPVVTYNFFAPLRSVPMEGTEVCDETPSLDNNLGKSRPLP